MKIIVYHAKYGCDTGCCGHRIDSETVSKFSFDHPSHNEDPLEFAKDLVREKFGEEHIKDLDWENCIILDD